MPAEGSLRVTEGGVLSALLKSTVSRNYLDSVHQLSAPRPSVVISDGGTLLSVRRGGLQLVCTVTELTTTRLCYYVDELIMVSGTNL